LIELILSGDHERRARKLGRIRNRSVALDTGLLAEVAKIIDDVRTRGDAALVEYAQRFDGVTLQPSQLRVREEALRESAARIDEQLLAALREAIGNVRRFHERQREDSWEIEIANGARMGQRIMPIEKAGLYVPGGTASYPSSVIMNVVPAQVAGVERIVVATPPNSLAQNPAVAAAFLELNVSEIYEVGGAQAIAALAYGTETVPAVDKITGPGNRFVAAAKKLVFGVVGVDSIAGPSEVVILADDSACADFVAADLLAQAEHDADSSAVLITTSEALARDVEQELNRQLETLPRRATAAESLARFGALLVVEALDDAVAIVNALAPEHLEVVTRDDEVLAAKIRNAGAIFLGRNTPEAVGDYFAGPNHVLPTGRAARFSSALGVYDFLKRTSMLRYSKEALAGSAEKIAALARSEHLEAHARSVLVRTAAKVGVVDE
jgi:histidinol dehydrogenase